MNPNVQAKVDAIVARLDIDRNRKVDLDDVRAVLAEQVQKRGALPVAAGAMIAGLVIGFVAGRASK